MPLIQCTFWDHQRIRMNGGRTCTRCGAWLGKRSGGMGLLERWWLRMLVVVALVLVGIQLVR